MPTPWVVTMSPKSSVPQAASFVSQVLMSDTAKTVRADGKPLFKELILAAPDVTRASFESIAKRFGGMSSGVTLYASSNDRALRASEILARGESPAGYVPKGGPLMLAGVDTIDVSAASTDFFSFNHSAFADRAQILKDMKLILTSGVHPPDKRFPVFELVTVKGGKYWKYER